MMMKYRLTILLAVVSLVVVSCKKDACNEPLAFNYDPEGTSDENCIWEPLNLNVSFTAEYDGEALVVNEEIERDGRKVVFEHFGMYLSQIAIKSSDDYTVLGDEFDNCTEKEDDVMLLTSDNTTYSTTVFTQSDIDGIRFNVGVDSCRNDSIDPVTREPDSPFSPKVPTMYWSWTSGYRFISINGKIDTSAAKDGSGMSVFEYHIGLNQFLRTVTIEDVDLGKTEQDIDLTVVMDMAKMLEGVDIMTERSTHTFNNEELAGRIADNALNAFRVE